MSKLNRTFVKHEILRYCVNNDMVLTKLTDEEVIAKGVGCILHVPIAFVQTQLKNGWELDEILQNEMSYVESEVI